MSGSHDIQHDYTDNDEQDLTLGQLLTRGIQLGLKVVEADSPNDPTVQSQLESALSDLTLCSALINRLGIFSPNETLEDVHTRDLRCFLVDAIRGQLAVLAKTKGAQQRIQWLQRAKTYFEAYIQLVDRYEVVPQAQRSAFSGPQHSVVDPSRRREHKIAQFKMERDVKAKLEELRTRRRERRPKGKQDDDEMAYDSQDDNDNDEADEIARPLYLHLAQLHYVRAHSELSSLAHELELLEHSMKMSELPSARASSASQQQESRQRSRGSEDAEDLTWRLDNVKGLGSRESPLLDPQGKVLRPFTILPSASQSSSSPLSTRLRLQSEIFRPSHNLPTMTIDEYLDQERERGNVLQGGGPNSSRAVEEARNEERGEKEDDTVRGYEREERELAKARRDDAFRDEHRRGEGNMHNRG